MGRCCSHIEAWFLLLLISPGRVLLQVATPDQAQEAHAFVRSWLEDNVSRDVAQTVRILYGAARSLVVP